MSRDGDGAGASLVARACPLCGGDEAATGGAQPPPRVYAEADFDPERLDQFAFASRKVPEYMHHRLLECAGCDLLYASPVPSLEGLSRAYDAAAFDSAREAWYAAGTYARLLAKVLPRLPDRSGALDIGTGDGAFLARLIAAGFDGVVGVEPSSAPIAAADPAVRPLIRHGTFRPDGHDAGGFSLITCFQTLEHVADPLAMIRSAMPLLKPGGAVALIVHDRRALANRAMGTRSPIFDIEHLQLFSRRGARALLERSGFVDVSVRSFVNRYPLEYWLKLAPLPTAAKREALAACRRSGLGGLPVALPVGNLVAVGFRPPAKVTPGPRSRPSESRSRVVRSDRGEAR